MEGSDDLPPLRQDVANWIDKSWEQVRRNNILNTWRHIGICDREIEDFIVEGDDDYDNNKVDDDDNSCRSDNNMFPDTVIQDVYAIDEK